MAAYQDLAFNCDILGVTQEYGLDGFTTPKLLSFAIELYEAGVASCPPRFDVAEVMHLIAPPIHFVAILALTYNGNFTILGA